MKRRNSRSVRYVQRSHLCEIADLGELWDYNQQLCSKAVRTLPEGKRRYPIIDTFVHEHRHGEPCEPHIRLVIDILGHISLADVPMEYFDKLSKAA